MSKKTTKNEDIYAVPRYSTKLKPFSVIIDDVTYVADKKKYARLECEKLKLEIAESNKKELTNEPGMFDNFYKILVEHFGIDKEVADDIPLSIVCTVVAGLQNWVCVYSEKKKI